MVEGFWIVQFEAVQGGGGGVLVLTKGRIFGGDSGYLYLGEYQADQKYLKGRVKVQQFLAGVPNVLGISGDFELDLAGTLEGDTIKATASLVTQAGSGLAIKLTRMGELP